MNTPSGAMNTPSEAASEYPISTVSVAARISVSQRMYWLVRRELWENRFVYIAPAAVAALALLASLVSIAHMAGDMRDAVETSAIQWQGAIENVFRMVSLMVMGVSFIVAIFYCLEALHGERKERSILFWKSMPVSDLETVLSKAAIPVLILPVISYTITVLTQALLLLGGSVVMAAMGQGAGTIWSNLPISQMLGMLLFHLLVMHGLWYAPIYGWLLMVSAWARRAALLWATLPLAAIAIAEMVAFHTSHFAAMLGSRLSGNGPASEAFPNPGAMHPLMHMEAGRFLLSAGLWVGLLVFGVFLAAAVQLRRYRAPL